MADILEVNRPTYQMEPDPPRFPLRRLIKYLVWIAIIGTVVTYRAELVKSAREALQEFDKSPPPPRKAAPVAVPPSNLPITNRQADALEVEAPEAGAPPLTRPALSDPPPHGRNTLAAAQPKTDPATWITTDDYPPAALREGRGGVTKLRVVVSPRGVVLGCQIVSSSGSPDLDQATCAAIRKRAHFTPAIDAKGRPVPGVWSKTVRWAIPE